MSATFSSFSFSSSSSSSSSSFDSPFRDNRRNNSDRTKRALDSFRFPFDFLFSLFDGSRANGPLCVPQNSWSTNAARFHDQRRLIFDSREEKEEDGDDDDCLCARLFIRWLVGWFPLEGERRSFSCLDLRSKWFARNSNRGQIELWKGRKWKPQKNGQKIDKAAHGGSHTDERLD